MWTLTRNADRLLPSAVRTLIQRRAARLPDDTKLNLADAAILGRSFSLKDLRAIKLHLGATEEGCTAAALAESLLPAAQAGLLVEHPAESPADYSFTHEQIREFAIAQLTSARQRSIHNALVDLLTADGDPPASSLSVLAHHALAAGDPARAVRFSIAAAQAALQARARGGGAPDRRPGPACRFRAAGPGLPARRAGRGAGHAPAADRPARGARRARCAGRRARRLPSRVRREAAARRDAPHLRRGGRRRRAGAVGPHPRRRARRPPGRARSVPRARAEPPPEPARGVVQRARRGGPRRSGGGVPAGLRACAGARRRGRARCRDPRARDRLDRACARVVRRALGARRGGFRHRPRRRRREAPRDPGRAAARTRGSSRRSSATSGRSSSSSRSGTGGESCRRSSPGRT